MVLDLSYYSGEGLSFSSDINNCANEKGIITLSIKNEDEAKNKFEITIKRADMEDVTLTFNLTN